MTFKCLYPRLLTITMKHCLFIYVFKGYSLAHGPNSDILMVVGLEPSTFWSLAQHLNRNCPKWCLNLKITEQWTLHIKLPIRAVKHTFTYKNTRGQQRAHRHSRCSVQPNSSYGTQMSSLVVRYLDRGDLSCDLSTLEIAPTTLWSQIQFSNQHYTTAPICFIMHNVLTEVI